MPLPKNVGLVFGKLGIGRDDREAIDHRLGDQHAVKRVTMVVWEGFDFEGMLHGNRKNGNVILQQSLFDPGIRHFEVQLAKTFLNGNFPKARNAQKAIGVDVFNCTFGLRR